MPGCWGWGSSGMGALGWVVMPIVWIALLALIVWAVTRLVHGAGGRSGNGIERHGGTPQDILDRRFASGEIDTSTYEQIRDRLTQRR